MIRRKEQMKLQGISHGIGASDIWLRGRLRIAGELRMALGTDLPVFVTREQISHFHSKGFQHSRDGVDAVNFFSQPER